jgi:hypothetical protein
MEINETASFEGTAVIVGKRGRNRQTGREREGSKPT